jgi:manganese transport protein
VFLILQRFGNRVIEAIIFVLMGVVSLCFVFEVIISKPSPVGILSGFIPRLPSGSVPIATGILGATIMPHNLYLHSGMVISRRSKNVKKTALNCTYALFDGIISLNIAFFVNASILIGIIV